MPENWPHRDSLGVAHGGSRWGAAQDIVNRAHDPWRSARRRRWACPGAVTSGLFCPILPRERQQVDKTCGGLLRVPEYWPHGDHLGVAHGGSRWGAAWDIVYPAHDPWRWARRRRWACPGAVPLGLFCAILPRESPQVEKTSGGRLPVPEKWPHGDHLGVAHGGSRWGAAWDIVNPAHDPWRWARRRRRACPGAVPLGLFCAILPRESPQVEKNQRGTAPSAGKLAP